MKKNYFGKSLTRFGGFLPVAAGFMLMPSFLFAQTDEQVKYIRSQSDLVGAEKLKKKLVKSTLTTSELMRRAKSQGIPFSGEVKGKHYQLVGFDKKGMPLYYTTSNAGASAGTHTNRLNSSEGPFKLNGENMKVHEWDGGGVLITHQELENRVTQKDKPRTNSSHATHVAGTMIASGIVPEAKGMASKAKLDAYEWTDDETEMIDAASNGALVSNHSYGFTGGFVWGDYAGPQTWYWLGTDEDTEYKLYGKYTENDRNWDLITEQFPMYLPVRAAGNPRGDGPEPGGSHFVRVRNAQGRLVWEQSTKVRSKNGGAEGFDCINHGALGKNILIVGAAHKIKNGYKQPSDVKMAGFSAFGPVDDGRIKPDIAGVGVGLTSSYTGGNEAYGTISGTSMASPNVTGSLLLLQEHYSKLNGSKFMRAATLKALAIHTANEAGPHNGPDYMSGWGLLNAHRAATTISERDKYSLIEEKTLKNKTIERINVTASGTEPLKITIAWTDPAPITLSDLDVANDRDTKALVNDLDIKVLYNGQEFLPWKLDPANPSAAATKGNNEVDNVEQVVIENPVAGGTYVVVISHKGDLKKNVFLSKDIVLADAEEQTYSLIATGITTNQVAKDLALNNVEVKVSDKEYSTETPVEFEVFNKGLDTVQNARISYKVINDKDGSVLSSGSIDIDQAIAPNTTIKKEALLDLSKSFVSYKIVGTVEVEGDEVVVNNTADASAYTTVVNLTEKGTSHKFGFEGDFALNGWTSEDTNQDGRTWRKYEDTRFAKVGSAFAINFPSAKKAGTNDWLFSNPIKVKGNTLYRVSLHTRKFQNPEEYLGIYFGTEANSGAMTNQIAAKVVAEGIKYKHYYYEFTPANDEIIYVGFNHNIPNDADTYAIALDEVKFEHAEGKPSIEFFADKLKPNTFETVSFTNNTMVSSTQPVTKIEWVFEPSTVTYQDGTTSASENPKVVFNQEGTYDVTLKVTNVEGESVDTKQAYITAKNTATKAGFKETTTSINEGETVTFTNTSTGNPAPTEYKWTITPSEGIEYTSGNATAQNVTVKFNNPGVFSVSLTAKSPHSSDTVEKANLITVKGLHEPVRNLVGNFDQSTNNVVLNWEKPNLQPLFLEDFEGDTFSVTTIDEDRDGKKWEVKSAPNNFAHSGLSVVESSSASFVNGDFVNFDVDNWLLTSKLPKGGEVLKFWKRNTFPERLAVYVVPAPKDGSGLTPDKIKTEGHLIYDTLETSFSWKEIVIDINQYTQEDSYIVFHHKTRKEDDGLNVKLDDIEVGYKQNTTNAVSSKIVNYEYNTDKDKVVEKLANEELNVEATHLSENTDKAVAKTFPRLTGYEVHRDGQKLTGIDDVDNRTFEEMISQTGSYTYDVYAVYADGKKSEKRTVTVDITTLSTSDAKGNDTLKIYPNPSDGRFVVEAKSGVSSLKAEVYDMSGKLVFKGEFKGNKAGLNLTQYPKGTYILNLVDNKGEKHSAKLMIK